MLSDRWEEKKRKREREEWDGVGDGGVFIWLRRGSLCLLAWYEREDVTQGPDVVCCAVL